MAFAVSLTGSSFLQYKDLLDMLQNTFENFEVFLYSLTRDYLLITSVTISLLSMLGIIITVNIWSTYTLATTYLNGMVTTIGCGFYREEVRKSSYSWSFNGIYPMKSSQENLIPSAKPKPLYSMMAFAYGVKANSTHVVTEQATAFLSTPHRTKTLKAYDMSSEFQETSQLGNHVVGTSKSCIRVDCDKKLDCKSLCDKAVPNEAPKLLFTFTSKPLQDEKPSAKEVSSINFSGENKSQYLVFQNMADVDDKDIMKENILATDFIQDPEINKSIAEGLQTLPKVVKSTGVAVIDKILEPKN